MTDTELCDVEPVKSSYWSAQRWKPCGAVYKKFLQCDKTESCEHYKKLHGGANG